MVQRAKKIEADKAKVLPLISKDEVTRIACDLVDIPSPTGSEQAKLLSADREQRAETNLGHT